MIAEMQQKQNSDKIEEVHEAETRSGPYNVWFPSLLNHLIDAIWEFPKTTRADELRKKREAIELAQEKLQQASLDSDNNVSVSSPLCLFFAFFGSSLRFHPFTFSEILSLKPIALCFCAAVIPRQDWDWTKTYSTWDRWEDPDILREKEEKERERAERATQRQGGGCQNHDRSAERKLMEMTTMEKIAECQKFNTQGNAFFEEGQYGRAALKYYRTLIYVEYVFPDTDEEDALLEHVKFIANLNSAACKLKVPLLCLLLNLSISIFGLEFSCLHPDADTPVRRCETTLHVRS